MKRTCQILAIVFLFVGLPGCSLVQGEPDSWDPLPLRELSLSAQAAPAASWDPDPPEGWPAAVPAPTFLVDRSRIGTSRPGQRTTRLTTQIRPDEKKVVAYIALLFEQGFEIDERAASEGWFVRDNVEWVALTNLATRDDLTTGNFNQSDALSGGFQVLWTTNPVATVGYCRVIEAGGESCRE